MNRTGLIAIVVGVDFVLDFVIAFGGVILGGGAATGSAALPSKGVLFLALVTGLVNAARTAQSTIRSYLAGPPGAAAGVGPSLKP